MKRQTQISLSVWLFAIGMVTATSIILAYLASQEIESYKTLLGIATLIVVVLVSMKLYYEFAKWRIKK